MRRPSSLRGGSTDDQLGNGVVARLPVLANPRHETALLEIREVLGNVLDEEKKLYDL